MRTLHGTARVSVRCSDSMTLGQSATLTLWDVTWVGTVKTALANSTEMGVACVYNVPTASSVGDSSTLSTSVRLLDGADAEITSSSVSLTVAADYTAGEKVERPQQWWSPDTAFAEGLGGRGCKQEKY